MDDVTTQTEPSVKQEHRPPGGRWRVALLASAEGRILLIGVGIALAHAVWLGIELLVSPARAQLLIGMTATELMFGRAAGLAFGYSLGLGLATVIAICMIVETVFVMMFYPLFVFSCRHLLFVRRLKRMFDRIQRTAEAHRHTIQRYGIIGLFAFVWFPFWMTGPAVGCVIGFLLGLKAWVNMAVVLTGTYTAIVSWALFLRHLHERVAAYSSYAPMVLVAVLILIVVAGHLLQRTLGEERHRRRRRR